MFALLRQAVALITALLLCAGALAQTPGVTHYGAAPDAARDASALAEGPVAPPVLAGPGVAMAGRGAVNDDGVLLTRPDDEDRRVSGRDESCRLGGSVDMGIGGGGGVMERDVGATVTYGQNGNPWRPCDDSHVGFAASVSRGTVTGTPRYRGADVAGEGRYGGNRLPYGDAAPYNGGMMDDGRPGLEWTRAAPVLGGP